MTTTTTSYTAGRIHREMRQNLVSLHLTLESLAEKHGPPFYHPDGGIFDAGCRIVEGALKHGYAAFELAREVENLANTDGIPENLGAAVAEAYHFLPLVVASLYAIRWGELDRGLVTPDRDILLAARDHTAKLAALFDEEDEEEWQ